MKHFSIDSQDDDDGDKFLEVISIVVDLLEWNRWAIPLSVETKTELTYSNVWLELKLKCLVEIKTFIFKLFLSQLNCGLGLLISSDLSVMQVDIWLQ